MNMKNICNSENSRGMINMLRNARMRITNRPPIQWEFHPRYFHYISFADREINVGIRDAPNLQLAYVERHSPCNKRVA